MALLVIAVYWESQTSWLQSQLLSAVSSRLQYKLEAGPSDRIRYPSAGPYDTRLGYSRLPGLLKAARESGFDTVAQVRSSQWLLRTSDWGLNPIYREKDRAGLRIADRTGADLYRTTFPERVYTTYEEIPAVVPRTLLFIENRELLDERYPRRNPAVEWDRLFRAAGDVAMQRLHLGTEISGGSTLATQIEKTRHSPGGRTGSVSEKFRQMASASLRSYLDGEYTLQARKKILVEYLNSIPLAAIPGYGEVHGLGDGLWAWYGEDFGEVNRILKAGAWGSQGEQLRRYARAYRQTLSLLLALQQPTNYLIRDRASLEHRVRRYLPALAQAGIIPPEVRDAALTEATPLRDVAPPLPPVPFSRRKAADTVRASLLQALKLESLYDLDRLDLEASATLDAAVNDQIAAALENLREPGYAAQAGILGHPMISQGDPAALIHSFTLYECAGGINLLRVQADNLNQPLNINEGTKLELGSTAKLRTLVTYLEIIAHLYEELKALSPAAQRAWAASHTDPLSRWAAQALLEDPTRSLENLLEAAMLRRYSANPGERFFTGGGLHQFSNFDAAHNGQILTVRDAFHNSVNLVFIRMMRDIVQYHVVRLYGDNPSILEEPDHPMRRRYLERFADWEGKQFLAGFYRKYEGKTPEEALKTIMHRRRPSLKRLAVVFRTVRPEASLEEFQQYVDSFQLPDRPAAGLIEDLYRSYAPNRFNLNDRGYLADIHPLELWLVAYWQKHPSASLSRVFAASEKQRQEVYEWLFRSRSRSGQTLRIRTMVEMDAFERIHRSWQKQGFPFPILVPSLATSIGSSGDNPAALAELMGIIMNGGVRYPTVKISRLRFASGTPYETVMERAPAQGERVLPEAVARLLRAELAGVVEKGTGRRALGAVQLPGGDRPVIGGKTGTGDNRFEVYAPGGRLIESRVINRTATFVFYIGDRFYGTITCYVPGEQAASYRFTSSLPVQIFRHLAARLTPLLTTPAKPAPPMLHASLLSGTRSR